MNGNKWMSSKNDSQIARLMLRLRANTLWLTDNKHEGNYDKAVIDSFDICVAQNHKVQEMTGKKHNKKHKITIENLKLIGDNQMKFSAISPGLLLKMLQDNDFYENKSHHSSKHHNEDKMTGDIAWIADIDNPKQAAYQLSLFMDKAWDNNVVTYKTLDRHFSVWLRMQLGDVYGKKVYPLMQDYYRLTSIRPSAYMTMPYGDTEFHSGEFGNELERYLHNYDLLKAKVEGIERNLPSQYSNGYFELVKYPIFSAALIAEKELEAQEARHIARPGLFNKDSEAKAAAAVSLNAYGQLKQLNTYYANIAKGRWRTFIDDKAAEMQAPVLPGTLSSADIQKYKEEAFDRNEDFKPLFSTTNDIIAKNAYDWTSITKGSDNQQMGSDGNVELISLMGHSNKVVKLAKGSSLSYTFYSNMSGDARFTIAAIPDYLTANREMRVSVSIDGAEPVVCQLHEPYNSKQWKFDLWRGQALKSFYTTLPKGNHNIVIKALDADILLDQWVLDFDVDREYYIIPVR